MAPGGPRLSLALATTLLAGALAGCLATPQGLPGAPAVGDVAAWRAELTEAVYDGVVGSVHYLAAHDGVQLSLKVYLPEGLPEGTRIPTLMELTPYEAQTLSGPAGGPPGPGQFWDWFVLRGAAVVQADARGTNGSEGCLDFGGSLDREDARTFVAWVREQPWSNGVVVTDGISHPGMGSVVAHAAVPDLQGALAHAPVVSYYQDEWLQGAKFEDQLNGVGYQNVELQPSFDLTPEAVKAQAAPCTGQTFLDFDMEDGPFTDIWQDRDLSRHAEEARAPILLTQGFVDMNVHPDHVQMYWDALPEDYPKHVIWGWWYHGVPDMDGHPAKNHRFYNFLDLRQRWLDALLFGQDNGVLDEPRVLAEDSQGTWHVGDQWPLEPSQWVTFWPGEDGALADAEAAEGTASYDDRPGARRGAWEGASVVFRTEPLDEPKLVNGAPVLDLVGSSTADGTKWVAYLMDEAPDGSWNRITHGYADSHSHGDEAEWLPMEPGTPYNWTLRLMPTAVVVEAGHRIALVIASQDSRFDAPQGGLPGAGLVGPRICFDDYRQPQGCFAPSGIRPSATMGRATNTVHLGPEATKVRLAWVDPALTGKAPPRPAMPEVPLADPAAEPLVRECEVPATVAGVPGVVQAGAASLTCFFSETGREDWTRWRSAVVEGTWEGLALAGGRLDARSQHCPVNGDCGLPPPVEGMAGPLRLELGRAEMAAWGDDALRAVLTLDGTMAQGRLMVRVSLFETEAPPADYGAFAAPARPASGPAWDPVLGQGPEVSP